MNEQTLYITVNEVQKQYLPMGKKKLRKILTTELKNTIRNGNRILVNRQELLNYLCKADNKTEHSTEI